MDNPFPLGVDKLSLWRLACSASGQDSHSIVPNDKTIHELQQLCKFVIANGGIEWATISPDFPTIHRLDSGDAMEVVSAMAGRPEATQNWGEALRRLTRIDVRREDWGLYRAHVDAALTIAAPARAETFNQRQLTATHVIEVEAGGERLLAWDIASRIAEILAPAPTSGPKTILVGLEKRYRIGEGRFRDEKLTPDDWGLLNAIWAGLPDVKDSTLEQFQEYREAFESMENKPEWALQANFENLRDEAKAKKAKIRSDHAELIDAAIKNGTLPALTDTRTKADKLWLGVTVSIEDACSYLKPLGFELKEGDALLVTGYSAGPSATQGGALPAGPSPFQRAAAQDSAILAEIAKRGYNPLALPKNKPGKAGVKAEIREALGNDGIWAGSTIFKRAWERLTGNGDIKING